MARQAITKKAQQPPTKHIGHLLAVWATSRDQLYLMHHARGHVVTDIDDGHWHGTDRATSLEGERAALIASTFGPIDSL